MSDVTQDKLMEFASIGIPLFIGFLGIAVMWGSFSSRLASADSNIQSLQNSQTQTANALSALQVQVGEINTSVQFIAKQYKQ